MLWYGVDRANQPNQGIVLLMPALLIGVAGVWAYVRKAPGEALFVLGVFGVYVLLFAKHHRQWAALFFPRVEKARVHGFCRPRESARPGGKEERDVRRRRRARRRCGHAGSFGGMRSRASV